MLARLCTDTVEILQETNDRHADDLNDTVDRAISLGLLTEPNSATSNLVDLFLQKAGYENRTLPPLDIDGKVHPVLLSISTAFDLIASGGTSILTT